MLYGDPFLETETEAYPDGYLARLADSGVSGVWLQAVLYKLSPFPWDEARSEHWQERLANLGKLVARAKRRGIGVYLYLNEPRAMPLGFYEECPEMKGVVEGDYATMCTSDSAVQGLSARRRQHHLHGRAPTSPVSLRLAARRISRIAWSHGRGDQCPRCRERGPEEVISELHGLIREGIARAGLRDQTHRLGLGLARRVGQGHRRPFARRRVADERERMEHPGHPRRDRYRRGRVLHLRGRPGTRAPRGTGDSRATAG